jgi:hypothetical protein
MLVPDFGSSGYSSRDDLVVVLKEEPEQSVRDGLDPMCVSVEARISHEQR